MKVNKFLIKKNDYFKKLIRPIYYFFIHIKILFKSFLFKSPLVPYSEIPIIINNRNRLTFLKKLITSLEVRGYKNIHILDNDSSYPPLIDYYSKCEYNVIFLKQNIGFAALWKSGVYKKFLNNYFVYTDSDVEIIDECPSDFLNFFRNTMEQDTKLYKIGLSLKIDDLPNHYLKKEDVLKWEQKYFHTRINASFFKANVDTTLALYRPWYNLPGANIYVKMYRSDFPYQLRHLPWYVDSNNLTEEECYYINNVEQTTHWSNQNKK